MVVNNFSYAGGGLPFPPPIKKITVQTKLWEFPDSWVSFLDAELKEVVE